MEDEITGSVATPEAPPGDAGTDTAAASAAADSPAAESFEPNHAVELKDDLSNIDEWIRADAARINAEAATSDTDTPAVAEQPAAPEAATEPAPAVEQPKVAAAPAPPAPQQQTQAEIDEASALAALQAKGYKVEAPAPPPDPYAALTARLAPFVGTAEEYAQTKAAALVPLPPEPTAFDAESIAAHEAAVKARNEAAAKLQRFDDARQTTDVAREWARQKVLGELGSALDGLPQTYALPPEKASRVTTPTTMTDAVAAVVETVTDRLNAEWQAKLDAETRKWQGEVARAKADRSVAAHREMGAAPQPSSGPGGRKAGPASIWETVPGTNLPTEAAIQAAIRGDFASIDLSDR